MILPGHVAASVLAARAARADVRVAILAGLVPDALNKLLHVAGLAPDTRVPMHTLAAWAATTAVVAAIAAAVAVVGARSAVGGHASRTDQGLPLAGMGGCRRVGCHGGRPGRRRARVVRRTSHCIRFLAMGQDSMQACDCLQGKPA